jgi:hypothetical protein
MALSEHDISEEELASKLHIPAIHEVYPLVTTLNPAGHEQFDLSGIVGYAQKYAESLRGVKRHGKHIIVDRHGYSYIFAADGDLGQYELHFRDRTNPQAKIWQMEGVVVRLPNPSFGELSIYSYNPKLTSVTRATFDNGIITSPLTLKQQYHMVEFLNRIKVPQRILNEV